MASAWAKAWGNAWGSAWGQVEAVTPPVVDTGSGGPDVFDAPYKAHVERIRKRALEEAVKPPVVETEPVIEALPVAELRIPAPSEASELVADTAQVQADVQRIIESAQAQARSRVDVLSRAAKRSAKRAAKREADRLATEDAEAIAIALALLEDD